VTTVLGSFITGGQVLKRRCHRAVIFLVLAIVSIAGCRTSPVITRASDGSKVTFPELVEDLSTASLVFVGETHDDPSHHSAQLEVIRALRDARAKLAIGLEMFRMDAQEALDRWVAGDLTEATFKTIYDENWSFPYELYRDIFIYAKNHRIPMRGSNISRDVTRQVARQGFASLDREQFKDLPEVSCEVDQAYENFIRRAFGMHGYGDMNFTYFCEAQLVWDTIMAWNLVRFLQDHPDYTVVVLAGSGHAWKPGIPAQVQRHLAISFRVILPEITNRTDNQTISVEDTDYIWSNP
jgi:uncharacterized iron-regulated protein